MHVKLLVTTGMVMGFVLGSWTPLGELGSLAALRGLVATSQDVDSTQIASLGRFRTLIAAAAREPAGNILQNRGVVLAAGFFDPEDAWAMRFSDLGRTNGIAMASWTDEDRSASHRGPATHQVMSLTAVPDREAWYSQTSEMELARLRTTIMGIEAENVDIEDNLAALDPAHPDHHMALCIYQSNEGLIAFYSFLTTMGQDGASLEDTAVLASVLEEKLHQTAQHGQTGRQRAADYASVLETLPAETAQDQRIKTRALEYYESFMISFGLEDTLAEHLAAYPALIEDAIATGEPPHGVSAWVADFQELGRSRMELQAWRQQITLELAGPGV